MSLAALSVPGDILQAKAEREPAPMTFTVPLEYTPRSPQSGVPFTEASFKRQNVPFTFQVAEVGIALVDLWNFGWESGPVGKTLGSELSLERGVSHAQRKRRITEQIIAPTVEELRKLGVQVFHCTAWQILSRYPQWETSTTEAERQEVGIQLERMKAASASANDAKSQVEAQLQEKWPPVDWAQAWRKQHHDLVYNAEWNAKRGKELYGWDLKFDIAPPVRPQKSDLLVHHSREQFHRLLSERKIRVLFYMGFETDDCVEFQPYGMANMQDLGYLCAVIRDATTTYETAETLQGQWKTKVAIDSIEARWGYSITSEALRRSIRLAQR